MIIRRKTYYGSNSKLQNKIVFRDNRLNLKSEPAGGRSTTLGDGSNECRVAKGFWYAGPFGPPKCCY